MSFNLRPGTSLFGNITFTPGTNENYVAPPIHQGPPPMTVGWSNAGLSESERVAPAANGMQLYRYDQPYTNAHPNRTLHNLPEYLEGLPFTVESAQAGPENGIEGTPHSLEEYTFNTSGTLYLILRADWGGYVQNPMGLQQLTVPTSDTSIGTGVLDPSAWTSVEDSVGYMGGGGDYGTYVFSRSVEAGTHSLNNLYYYAFKADATAPAAPEPAPSIVTEGLTFHVDAGNISSYSGSGTTWTDLSGNGIDGTFVNGPTYSSDDGGKIVFDNSDDYINFTSPTLAFGTGPFAMEIWVKVTSAPDQFDQIMQGRTPDATGVFWGYRSGNLDFLDNNDSYPLLRKSWPTQGEWTHLVITRDASNIVSLYRNGVLDEGTVSNELSFDQTEMTIGSSFGYNVGREVGLARLYVNKGLSAEEVTQNYDDAKSRFGH